MDNFQPKVNIGLVGTWFAAAYTCLLFAIFLSVYTSTPKVVSPTSQKFNLFAALPESNTQVSEEITSSDGRAKIIENFFQKHNSPLVKYAQNFIDVADKYNLDYRLLPSISMQESKAGQKVIENSFNPFGYGIYGSLVTKFNSWDDAIERVGRALREDYLNKGLNTPSEIMAKYTPPSLSSGGTWAKGVSQFMTELQ